MNINALYRRSRAKSGYFCGALLKNAKVRSGAPPVEERRRDGPGPFHLDRLKAAAAVARARSLCRSVRPLATRVLTGHPGNRRWNTGAGCTCACSATRSRLMANFASVQDVSGARQALWRQLRRAVGSERLQ